MTTNLPPRAAFAAICDLCRRSTHYYTWHKYDNDPPAYEKRCPECAAGYERAFTGEDAIANALAYIAIWRCLHWEPIAPEGGAE